MPHSPKDGFCSFNSQLCNTDALMRPRHTTGCQIFFPLTFEVLMALATNILGGGVVGSYWRFGGTLHINRGHCFPQIPLPQACAARLNEPLGTRVAVWKQFRLNHSYPRKCHKNGPAVISRRNGTLQCFSRLPCLCMSPFRSALRKRRC
jgi:hypothetical protein